MVPPARLTGRTVAAALVAVVIALRGVGPHLPPVQCECGGLFVEAMRYASLGPIACSSTRSRANDAYSSNLDDPYNAELY